MVGEERGLRAFALSAVLRTSGGRREEGEGELREINYN